MSLSLAVHARGLVIAVAVLLVSGGADQRDAAAQASAPWMAPAPEKAKRNPPPSDEKTIEQGEKAAKVNCVSCPGNEGKGDGPAAVALNPKPADWTSNRVQDMPDGEILWKIAPGRGPMLPWEHLPENDRWAIVRYIRTLAGK